jgi:hypothetical protein
VLGTLHSRKLIALVCLAAILLVALAQGASELASAIPGACWLLLEILVFVSIRRRTEERSPDPFLFATTVPARAPPIQ